MLTVGAEYSKLFVVVEHCFDEGKAAGSIRSRSLKMLVERESDKKRGSHRRYSY